MIPVADKILKDCERFIAAGDMTTARKLSRGLSIITGNPAWQRAYDLVIDSENPMQHVRLRRIKIPASLASYLHLLHDEGGEQFPNQSARNGTQVDLSADVDVCQWLTSLGVRNFAGVWTTRLGPGGLHIPHIHPRGMNSYVIYIEVPQANDGHLYFGVPRYVPMLRRYRLIPEPGLMVSFPNWLWHGVTEYTGERPRLTIAFDTHG